MPEKENLTNQHPDALIGEIKSLIEQGRNQAVAAVNSALTITYWHVGRRINEELLGGKRAEYGKKVVEQIAEILVLEYGRGFEAKNLHRMMKFAGLFPDFEIVAPLVRQLRQLLPAPTERLDTSIARQGYDHAHRAFSGLKDRRILPRTTLFT